MNTSKKSWVRVAVLIGIVAVSVGVVRLGRLQGRASGGNAQAGCGRPLTEKETTVPTENPVSERPVEIKQYKEIAEVPEQAFPGRVGKLGKGRITTPQGELMVDYTEIDGQAVIGGDVVMSLDEIRTGDGATSGGGRSSSSTSLYPGGTVYYQIDSALDSGTQSEVNSAISHWETYTNLDFVNSTGSGSYIKFTSGSGCSSSSIGKSSGVTTISLASGCSTGNAIHEIGHAIGLIHEQSRTDRDSYITLNWSLISSDWTYQYQTWTSQGYGSTAMQTLGDYDYGSVMHYGKSCPTDSSKTCITAPETIGQRDGLSENDIDAVKTMYSSALEQTIVNQWWGANDDGAGMAIADLDSDGKPEAIMVHVDNPSGENYGYYRVAWDMTSTTLTNNTATTYRPTSYGNPTNIGGWWGTGTNGAGLAVGDIDKNGRPDLVVVHVDDPSGADSTYYRIGWNISTTGVVTSWSSHTKITAGFHGSSTTGADVALYDINGNGTLDIVVGTMDNASGSDVFYWNVGWDISTSGSVSSWTSTQDLTGFGSSTYDVGLDVADMDGNGKADMVLSWVDAASGEDVHYWRVAYDLSTSTGAATGWSGWRTFGSRMGTGTDGADVAVYDFDADGNKDVVAFHLDREGTGNAGYLHVTMDQSDKVYELKVKNSGLCMDVEQAYTADGTEIQQWGCNNTNAQKYTASKTSDGYYLLIAKNAGKCVDVSGVSTTDGAAIHLWSCAYTDNQKWSLTAQSDGTYLLKAKHSGKCIDMYGYSTTAGSPFVQWTCNATDNQKFTLTTVTN